MMRNAAVRIVGFETTPVAAFEHRGGAMLVDDSVRRFIAWRRRAGLTPSTHATFNIIQPGAAGENFDLCVATDDLVQQNADGIVAKVIRGGRCAVLRHAGPDTGLGAAVLWLYRDWLPASGAELRQAPLFFQRVRMFPFVPLDEAITDIFLPIETDRVELPQDPKTIPP